MQDKTDSLKQLKQAVKPELWTEKHKPSQLEGIVGQKKAIDEALPILSQAGKAKAALLTGPAGCGKTLLVETIAKQYQMQLQVLNASDQRNLESIEQFSQTILPENPVNVGDSWPHSTDLEVPMFGKLMTQDQYRFIGWDQYAGRRVAVLEVKGSISAKPTRSQNKAPMKMFIDQGSGSGRVLYDPELHMTIGQEMYQTMAIRVEEVPGQATRASLSNHVVIRFISLQQVQ